MSGLLLGWIGCLNSQEWCSRLRALYLCTLFCFVLPPRLCSCSATAVKGFREGVFSRKVVFSPYTASVQVNSLWNTHICIYSYTFKYTKSEWRILQGRISLYLACSIIQLFQMWSFNEQFKPELVYCTIWPREYWGLLLHKHVGCNANDWLI